MKIQKLGTFGMAVLMSALLLLSAGFAFAEKRNDKSKPMKPELAAKKEMVRKQHEQRVTDPQRKSAANALKAERLKVQQAKELVKRSKPENSEAQ